MLLRRVAIENVRSFLEKRELLLEGGISILIGPNGGGKTNLLDAIVIMLRRHLFASMYAVHSPTAEQPGRYEFRVNDALNQLILDKHSAGANLPQILEVELEVSRSDVESMRVIMVNAETMEALARYKYVNLKYNATKHWDLNVIREGGRFIYRLENGKLVHGEDTISSKHFLEFLQLYEIDSQLRDEFGLAQLSTPMIYLPVNRTASALTSTVELAGYNKFEQKRQSDIAISRTSFSLVPLAIGRLAQKHRMLLEQDTGRAQAEFDADPNVIELRNALRELGYEWELVGTEPLKNAYDVRLTKQGKSFMVSRASSGERELLTYLFSIYALNVRDALVVVDEPELHLHPKWQAMLLGLFRRLSEQTGNQFLLATHSPTFVSPSSIQFVSRVYSEGQSSNIIRLNRDDLPDAKHFFNIVNSHNNERVFFADKVLLVEGLSDRIFAEAYLGCGEIERPKGILEVVSVGGKGMIPAYQRLLGACSVDYSILADLDYIEQIGPEHLKALFVIDEKEIVEDVLESEKSKDGTSLVSAIDRALTSGNWDEARDIWAYIKSRRRRLKPFLSDEEEQRLSEFVSEKRKEGVYLLRYGSLEDYLPAGVRGKDMEKLIRFLAQDEFVSHLPIAPRTDIELIFRAVVDF
jgi:putative ATP-dependent endonuclease of the OLD family